MKSFKRFFGKESRNIYAFVLEFRIHFMLHHSMTFDALVHETELLPKVYHAHDLKKIPITFLSCKYKTYTTSKIVTLKKIKQFFNLLISKR